MRPNRRESFAHLDRRLFAEASSRSRAKIITDWLTRGNPAPPDADVVRRVRERDLGDARAMFGPFLTMVSVLGALTIAAVNWQFTGGSAASTWILLVSLLAPLGMFAGLAGSGLALHQIATINRELARLDARSST